MSIDYYVEQYRKLHEEKPAYGSGSGRYLPAILPLARDRKSQSILDFGAGKSKLAELLSQQLGIQADRYDPAIPEISIMPDKQYDLVICTDVMEHIPEQHVATILQQIRARSANCFLHVSTRLAKAVLPSGENAHATVRPADWWRAQILKHFSDCVVLDRKNDYFSAITWQASFVHKISAIFNLKFRV
ncbi:MAG: methyltransferase domain-containing protein [Parvibaculum sp.]|nr:methyltransferase domain-containing protein [Parvibaculum sp.]